MADDSPPCNRTSCADQLSHQAHADHRHPVAQSDAGDAHRVHGDAPSVAKQACSKGTPSGMRADQIASREDGLAVPRAFAAVSYALADRRDRSRWRAVSATTPAPE